MDRGGNSAEVYRRLRQLEHALEAGDLDWREYRATKAELMASLGSDEQGDGSGEADLLSFEGMLGKRTVDGADDWRWRHRRAA
ncbi:MAG: hypothetical protein U0935_03745 [Pirellulales bacterium]